MPRHIYGEVDEREKKSGLQVCSQLLAGYNMDSNKSGERMRDEM